MATIGGGVGDDEILGPNPTPEQIALAAQRRKERLLAGRLTQITPKPTKVQVVDDPLRPNVSIENHSISPNVSLSDERGVSTSFIPPFAEALDSQDIKRLTGTPLEQQPFSFLYETTSSLPEYLRLRQKQIAEFAQMGEYMRKQQQEQQSAENAKATMLQRYRDMFYLHQTADDKIKDINSKGERISTFAKRGDWAWSLEPGAFFGYDDFFPWQHKREDAQNYQLMALMKLFDRVEMTIDEKNPNNFTLQFTQDNGNKIDLLTGTHGDNGVMNMSCSKKVLDDPALCDRALCLMVDQRKRLLARTYNIKHKDSFPIEGKAKPETLVRLYQLSLVQGLNPTLEGGLLQSIIDADNKNNTNYSKLLACLIKIKEKSGKQVSEQEQAFMQALYPDGDSTLKQDLITMLPNNKRDYSIELDMSLLPLKIEDENSNRYLGRILQQLTIDGAHKRLLGKSGLLATDQDLPQQSPIPDDDKLEVSVGSPKPQNNDDLEVTVGTETQNPNTRRPSSP